MFVFRDKYFTEEEEEEEEVVVVVRIPGEISEMRKYY